MPTLDIFNNDAFSLSGLTTAIENTPHTPTLLGDMGLFHEEGITTTTFMLEKRGTTISLVPSAERGNNRGLVAGNDKSSLIPFKTIHLPQSGSVLADEVQNVRAFGKETEVESVMNIVNRKLRKMRLNLDATIEFQRIGAIKGTIVDADGSSVLLDLYASFGLLQQTHQMLLDNDATKVKIKVVEATCKVEDKLGAIKYSGLLALCGKGYFDKMVAHPSVEAAYQRWLDGQFLRESQRSQDNGMPGFPFAGVVWKEYRGTVGGVPFIGDDEAYLIPMGIPDLFITNYAPADYMETVNTTGLPYYAKQELMRMGKGVELEAQSNPISLCTRPDVIVKLLRNT